MFYRDPERQIWDFDYSLSYPTSGTRFPLNVTIHVASTDLPKPNELTNSRLAVALSVLGGYFDQHWDLNTMHEWEFDVALSYFAEGTIQIIANGNIVGALPAA